MNGAYGTGFSNAYIKYHAASVEVSSEETLRTFTLCGNNSTMLEMRSDLLSVKKSATPMML